jgi:hypothetical protein
MFGKKELPATEEHFREWTHARSRGEAYFVLTRGILTALICEVLSFLIVEVWPGHKSLDSMGAFVLNSAIPCIICGFMSGSYEWGSNEKRYSRELLQFSSANYDSPEQTLRELQRGMTNVVKH